MQFLCGIWFILVIKSFVILQQFCKIGRSIIRHPVLHKMAVVSEAVYNAFQPDKLNYSLLGVGDGLHMHWHIHPRRHGDTLAVGPVWQLGKDLTDKKYNPTSEELEMLKTKLKEELDKLLVGSR